MRRRILAGAAAMTLALAGAACGGDDGADVRDLGGDGSSVSGSGSGSGRASGSGSGSGSTAGSGSATDASSASASGVAAECVPGDTSGADTTVQAELTEWAIEPDPTSVPTGTVAFEASTQNAAEPHELVIAKGDDPSGLPTDEDGAVDESQLEEGALIGEIEAFPAGETCAGAFDLPPGDYVLFCNIVETEEDGTVESHYAEGMATSFTVEG